MDFIPPPMPPPGIDEEALKKQKDAATTDSDSTNATIEKVEEATRLKSEGLTEFKEGKLAEAETQWLEAVTALHGCTSSDAAALLQSLHSNLSLVYLKQGEWSKCANQCSTVLAFDPKNTKALYRRSKAYLENKNGEGAKSSLVTLIHEEPGNREYRRMFEEASELAKVQKEEKKSNMSNLFSKPGLYDDKEKQRERKLKEEAEAKEKKRRDFEDEMAKRATDGRDQLSFEDWEKELTDAEKERQQKIKDERKKQRESKATSSPVVNDTGSDDYTEEEKKILMETKKKGYCYFKNSELTAEERAMKQKINKNAPTKLAEAEPQWTPDQAGVGSGLSSWNCKGTSYEERDMTKWAKEMLKSLLLDVKDASVAGGSLSFTEVLTCDGEANAAVVRGTNRYFYDFEIKIRFEYVPTAEELPPSTGELIYQPTNVATTDDPDSPDWLKEGRIIWRKKEPSVMDISRAIHAKGSEVILCLIKGFEDSFAQLIAAKSQSSGQQIAA